MGVSHSYENSTRCRCSNYGFFEILKNVIAVARNRIEIPTARLVRYPIVIRGKKYIDFGSNLTTGYHCRLEVNGKHEGRALVFGNNVNIGDYVSIRCAEKVIIGDNVLIGSRVLIIDNTHGKYKGDIQDNPKSAPNNRELYSNPVNIKENVWVGDGVVIQSGVTVGSGCIIAANSVVTKNIPDYCMVGGAPAKVIKKWNEDEKEWITI